MAPISKRTFRTWSLRTLILFGVTAAIYATLADQDWPAIHRAVLSTSRPQILYASLIFVVSRIFQTARFYTLCPGGFNFAKHIGLNMGSQAGIILLPFRAGELFRPYLMNRWNKALKWSALLFWILLEKIIEGITLLPMLVVSIWALDLGESWKSSFLIYSALAAVGIVTGVLYRHRLRVWIHRIVQREQVGASLVLPFVTSVVSWLSWWWLFYAFMPNPMGSLALSVGVILASSIPALPAGLGAFEAAYVWVAGRWGVSSVDALADALVLHALIIVWTLVWGVPYLLAWGIPNRTVIEAENAT